MIQILNELSNKDKATFNKVLHQLFIRGEQLKRPYVRYSYKELEQIANFLTNHQYDVTVPVEEIDHILGKFNKVETQIFQSIAKRSPEMREDLPDIVRKENHRTRQYVQAFLSGREQSIPSKKNGIKELKKIKARILK